MNVLILLGRIVFVLLYIVLMPLGSMAFFAPVLWPFAVFVQNGELVSASTFGLTLVVMVVAWGVLFVMYSATVRLNRYVGDESTVVNEAFHQASLRGDHPRAAWILFQQYWSLGMKKFGRQMEA